MADTILCLNAGSSSIKFALFHLEKEGEPVPAGHGKIEKIGIAPVMTAWDIAGAVVLERHWDKGGAGLNHEALMADLLDGIERHVGADLRGVGHRVVHGGIDFVVPVLTNEDVLKALDALCPLAPLHQPHNLSAIRAIAAHRPHLPQVACFDTAFHHAQPAVARRIALPRRYADEGVLRYGFHGLSYEYIMRRLEDGDPLLAGERVIAAHLGNGASLCAMKDGRSIDTTMGFTALDGLMMGTRCGSIDPGVLLYLLQRRDMDASAIEDLLYSKSGLLGVSGLSSDMRTLLASDDPHAAEAVELFVYRVVREAGALAATLGGLDQFVFTGGIGENAAEIRSRVAEGLAWLGAELDEDANHRGDAVISTATSRLMLRVVPTDEEGMIAIHTQTLLENARS